MTGREAMAGPPPLSGVLETVLYFSDQARTAAFYGDLLGMRLLDQEPGRSLFYRAGDSVFLLFRGDRTREGGSLPPHGARGPIHTCFRVPPERYDDWRAWIEERGVTILRDVQWNPGRSFYFEDPDGNLLEIVDRDIWPA